MDDADYLESLGYPNDTIAMVLDAIAYAKQAWLVKEFGYPRDNPEAIKIEVFLADPKAASHLIEVLADFGASPQVLELTQKMADLHSAK